jgi:hypothetical protein
VDIGCLGGFCLGFWPSLKSFLPEAESYAVRRRDFAAVSNMSVWLVAVPNESSRSSETTFLELKAETASARHDYAGAKRRGGTRDPKDPTGSLGRIGCVVLECYRMELPSDLLVGTLDSLMVRWRDRFYRTIRGVAVSWGFGS